MEYIQDKVYVLVVVLAALGIWLKNTPKIPDWLIPYILGMVGITLASFMLQDIAQGFIQGVLVTSVSVYGHNLVKQYVTKRHEDPKNPET